LHVELLPFGNRRLLILLLLLVQLFGKITFAVTMGLGLLFVDAKHPGYIIFVNKIICPDYK
jgi:hypothetical protein